MSLIDEALKRARQEAARQEATEREARYAQVPVYMPAPRRARAWLLPAVLGACLAVGVAGGVFLARRPVPHAPASALPGPHPLSPGGTPAKVVEQPVIEELEGSPSPSPGEGDRGGGRGGQGVRAPIPPPPKPAATPAPEPAAVSAPQQAPPALPQEGPVVALPQPPPAETHSYVREVPIPGGGTLRLNGIAFSAQPVALFGDKVVAPGETVSSFTVLQIEAQRVKLQWSGGNVVYVTLK